MTTAGEIARLELVLSKGSDHSVQDKRFSKLESSIQMKKFMDHAEDFFGPG